MNHSLPFRKIRLRARWHLLLLALGCLAAVCACGTLRPAPESFDPKAYTPIQFQDLLHPQQAGLHDGQLVRVDAYFWQSLTYDPAMVSNYLTLPRYPIDWYRLRWFAVYGSEDMRSYYDLVAMTPEQAEHSKLSRLDPIAIYGEMTALPPHLYLMVHHIEKIPPR